jgi:hypothetical protein
MLADLVDSLGRNIDALGLVLLIVMLTAVAVHADRRYTDERNRNEQLNIEVANLNRRNRSLQLIVQFQDSTLTNLEAALTRAADEEAEPSVSTEPVTELEGKPIDEVIMAMEFCLSCHKLAAPSHFKLTKHLALGDNSLEATTEGR